VTYVTLRNLSARKRLQAFFLVPVVLFLSAMTAHATLDLTNPSIKSGFLNGALFTVDQGRGGTGVFDTFVKIQTNDPVEEGYNTGYRPAGDWPDFLDQVNTSPQVTRDIRLVNVPYYAINGVEYYEFALDINQKGTGDGDYLSLDRVIIFTSPTGKQIPADLEAFNKDGRIVRYDMDLGPDGDSTVLLDGRRFVSTGSGKYDMLLLVPKSCFVGANLLNDYVYIYSHMGSVGGEYAANSGDEEWRILSGFIAQEEEEPEVPEPLSLTLFSLSVLGGLTVWRRRK